MIVLLDYRIEKVSHLLVLCIVDKGTLVARRHHSKMDDWSTWHLGACKATISMSLNSIHDSCGAEDPL